MQSQLLKHIIDNPKWIPVLQEDLFQQSHHKLFKILQQLDSRGLKPTYDSLLHVCRSKELLLELDTIVDIQSQKELDGTHFQLLLDEQRTSSIHQFVRQISIMENMDVKEYNKVLKRLYNLQNNINPHELTEATSFFNWKSHKKEASIQIGSGFQFLENTGSDFCKGNLIVCVAPSGHGKSAILAHIAKHLFVTKRNVLCIAFEETDAQFKSRIGKGILKMSTYDYDELTEEQLELRFEPKLKTLGQLEVITGSSLNAEDLEDMISDCEEAKGFKFDAIIIDYGKQIMLKNQNKNAREDQNIASIFRMLKEVAIRKGNERLIVTAVQSNRSGFDENKRLGPQNIADSMGSMHNADFVLGAKRKSNPDYFAPEDQKDQRANDIPNLLKLSVIKKREGSIREGDSFIYTLTADGNINMIDNQPQAVATFEGLLDDPED